MLASIVIAAGIVASGGPDVKAWDVKLRLGTERHTLRVAEGMSILTAVELAGLLPSSDCRRGNCLSCAARVVGGAPFSLAVSGTTALCDEAHSTGLVLLCSAFACGPDLELQLGADGDAWEMQHTTRWMRDSHEPLADEREGDAPQFRMPDDLIVHLERSAAQPSREADAAWAAPPDGFTWGPMY